MSPSKPREAQRIAKLLARAGIASRREIERMIAEGRIALDGKTLETPATIVTSLHGVTVDGKPVRAPDPARLFLFHKPAGLLTAANDPAGRPTIYTRIPKDLPRLMPVGRLDLNTEGLLLLTTDGELKRELELPATGVERSYRARAYGDVTQEQLEALIDGIEIEGVRYGSIDANLERRTGANVWIEMTLTEGKNREVRRVLEHLGLQVGRLIRTRYGPFVLGDLPVGEIGEVRQHDLIAFRKTLSLPPAQRAKATYALRTEGAAAKPRPVRPPQETDLKGREPDAPRSRVRAGAAARPGSSTRPGAAGKPVRPDRGAAADRAGERPARAGERPQHTRSDSMTSERPVRGRRDEHAPRVGERAQRGRSDSAASERPVRGRRHEHEPREDIANPKRAARARTHRDNREPREGELIDRPRTPAPSRGPAGGRGKPPKKPRPPRTRK